MSERATDTHLGARTGPDSTPVTRMEILDATGDAFDNPPLSRDDILATAVAHDARPAVIDVLQSLPGDVYRQRSDLWAHLSDVPID